MAQREAQTAGTDAEIAATEYCSPEYTSVQQIQYESATAVRVLAVAMFGVDRLWLLRTVLELGYAKAPNPDGRFAELEPGCSLQ